MSQAFDPYEKLLGMTLHGRAPDDWELLGIDRAERDHGRIADAYHKRLAILKAFEVGTYADETQQLIEEVSNAYHRLTSGKSPDAGSPSAVASPPTKAPTDSTVIEQPPVAERPQIAPRTPPPRTTAPTLPSVPQSDHALTDAKAVASGQAQERPVAQRLSPSPMGVAAPVAAPAPAVDISQSAVVGEETVGPPQRRKAAAGSGRAAVATVLALLLLADRLLRRAVGQENELLHHFARVFCLLGAIAVVVGTTVVTVNTRRETARARTAAKAALQAAQTSQQRADEAFRTPVRPPAYSQANQSLGDGRAALAAADYGSAQARLIEAATAFEQSRAEAPVANALGEAQAAWTVTRAAADEDLLKTHAPQTFASAESASQLGEANAATGKLAEATASYRAAVDALDQAVREASAARKQAEEVAAALQKVRNGWQTALDAADQVRLAKYAAAQFQAAQGEARTAEASASGNPQEATAGYERAIGLLTRAVAEAADSLASQCRSAIAKPDKTAAENLLSDLKKLMPADSRIVGLQKDVAGLTPRPAVTPPSSVAGDLPTLTNSIGMQFVLIPAGEFLMGSPDSDRSAASDEKPQHGARITTPFRLGVYEVTQGQYEQVMRKNPSTFKESGVDAPVEQVSWNDAQEFCRKLSELAAEREAGRVYRLPTEAEWEYACRAGSTTRYPFGDSDATLGEYAWYSSNAGSKTHPVGRLKPNAWGLYDMLGNVYEWCQDGRDERYYQQFAGQVAVDPVGPSGASLRVLRGGSWGGPGGYCRPAYRSWGEPGFAGRSYGFRLALGRSGE